MLLLFVSLKPVQTTHNPMCNNKYGNKKILPLHIPAFNVNNVECFFMYICIEIINSNSTMNEDCVREGKKHKGFKVRKIVFICTNRTNVSLDTIMISLSISEGWAINYYCTYVVFTIRFFFHYQSSETAKIKRPRHTHDLRLVYNMT